MKMPKYICYKVIQESKDGKRLVNVPSENVEEVVRCKDCIHIHDHDCPITWDKTGDDYCSYGERKR